jgi:hypothetical protein
MNPPSGPRPQKQQQQQKQKTLIIKKPENTLDFHSRLIEAAEVCFSTPERAKSSPFRSFNRLTALRRILDFVLYQGTTLVGP